MKKFSLIGFAIALSILITALFWFRFRGSPTGTTTMQLAGADGTSFTGYYTRNGQRVDVSDKLPWKFDSIGVTEFEFRKVSPDDTFTLQARYDESGGAHAMTKNPVGPSVLGVRGQVQQHGLSTQTFSR